MASLKFNDPLGEPKLKIKWAKRETQKINSLITDYIKTKPYGQRTEVDLNSFQKVFKFGLTQQPPELLRVDVGQTINVIRSSLDLLMVALATLHAGSNITKTVKFPFGKTEDIFLGEINRIKNMVPVDAVAMIKGLKPYSGGNSFLFALHDADVNGKHRKIVDVRLFAKNLKMEGLIEIKTAGFFVFKKSAFSDWASLEEGTEFFRLPLDSTNNLKYDVTFDIVFRNINTIEGQSVTATLQQFLNLVESIVLSFEKRFFI